MTDILEGLNPDQKAAVRELQRPVFVLAGPGTGKTRVTCTKIAYLIKDQGLDPDQVLALTFSDKAAGEMKERVLEMVPGVADIQISTFHSFCNNVIRENALELGINTSGPIIEDEHQQAFLLGCLDRLDIQHFKIPPRPIELAATFQKTIGRFKQENISALRLETYLKEERKRLGNEEAGDETEEKLEESEELELLGKLEDLARAYRAYEEFKQEKGLMDFGDMQLLTLKLFNERPALLARYRKQFQYLIVDEFQDTDYIQLQLIFLLAPQGKVTVVGDDDQSIYRFRGAYLTNIKELQDFYHQQGLDPAMVVLGTNYRCSGNIQELASAIIRNNSLRVEKELRTFKGPGVTVDLSKYMNDGEQAKGMAQKASELHQQGLAWEEMAVLVRRRVDALPIADLFARAGIPLEFVGSKKYFREPVVRAAVAYLKVLSDPVRHQPALAQILMRPVHGILPEEIPRLSDLARKRKLGLWELLRVLDEDYPGDRSRLLELRTEMDGFFEVKGEQGLLPLVRAVLFGRDLFRVELARKDEGNIRLLSRLLQLCVDFLAIYPEADLDSFLVPIQALTDLGLGGEKKERDPSGKVQLMTVHASKGKEFPVVFLPCLNQGRFPSRYKRYKLDIPEALADTLPPEGGPKELHLQEERRLFYVATTRAKERLFLSYCDQYRKNKRGSKPSQFLEEFSLESSVVDRVEELEPLPDPVEEAETREDAIFQELVLGANQGEWDRSLTALSALALIRGEEPSKFSWPGELVLQDYLDNLSHRESEPVNLGLKNVRYSPSKLSRYEECPKKFWFSHVLRIPGEKKSFFALGSVVHETIEFVTNGIRAGEEVSLEEALAQLDSLWDPSAYQLESQERQDKDEARKMIEDFLVHQAGREGSILAVEKWIELDIDGRRLVGKVDRIDELDGALEVIDYKSSKSRTSRPKLKQDFQMVLYWLGVESAYQRPVSKVGHWYLRMDQEWMVEISSEERELVLERARAVISGVEAGNFQASPDASTCRYCDYAELCDEKE